MENSPRIEPSDYLIPRILTPANYDVQTQTSRLERLNGLRGMAWAYATCHHLQKKPSAVSLEFSAPESSFGSSEDRKMSSNVMRGYIAGERAPTRGPRGKLGFDLVGAISADPRGARAEKWLTHRLWKMLHPATTLARLRELLYELHPFVRLVLFDSDPALKGKHVSWRRYRIDDSAVPRALEDLVLAACAIKWHPRGTAAADVFALFEALVGLWCEARLMCNGARMQALHALIIRTQDLALADETFLYIIDPFLAFLSFDGPDYPTGDKRVNWDIEE
ncbi:hypothetical protein P3T43_003962 [Paraburkholderia sp. GAS41]|uniref:hypothetical protein n=1 Tax=Paraburkholderia sp. GAS41 TaxID=3035134 RepID=UPI003D222B8B